jgi:DNA-binding transcriptional ArsR family regulator
LQYNKAVDESIINLLLDTNRLSYGDLKKQLDFVLAKSKNGSSNKSFEMFDHHLKKLQADNILDRSKEGVNSFYSLNENYKKQRLFDILGVHTDQIITRAIYAKLFKMQIRDFPSYYQLHVNIEQLESYLKNRRATLQDMQEIYSNRDRIENKRNAIITDYKLRQTGEIISKVEYATIDTDGNVTNVVYYLGESSGVYTSDLVLDKLPKRKVEELLESLVESRLIQQVEKVLLKIVDDKLRHLIHDFHLFKLFKLKNIVTYIKQKHADTLKEYEFLHDTIKEIYPDF